MPDSKRIDLSTNLDEIGEDLLKHVRAATEEVKHRQAADQAKEARSIQREKSKKTSFALIAVGAVVVLLLSYWVVFARPSTSQGGAINAIPQAKSANVTIKPPVVTSTARATNGGTSSVPVGRSQRTAGRPSDSYEQPGM